MYEINAFFWFKSIFMAELLVAEALVAYRLKKRKNFTLRAIGAVLTCIAFSFAVPVLEGPIFTPLIFISLFAFSLCAMKFCFKEEWKVILFCGVAGYTAQHIASQIFDISIVAMGLAGDGVSLPEGSNPVVWLPIFSYGSGTQDIISDPVVFVIYLAIIIVTYFSVFVFIENKWKKDGNFKLRNLSLLIMVSIIILFDVVMSSIVSYYSAVEFDKFYIILFCISNIFCCLLSLYIQFNVALVQKLESDLKIITRLREQELMQFQSAKENIDMINVKCHDLKHQIRTIGSKNAIDMRAVKEIESIISIYDSRVKTGNDALDVILTEKSLFCVNNEITLSCIADGKLLNFMSDIEIYSMFGNLVDNAVEAVIKLPKEKRVINFIVKEERGVVFVNIYNYFDGNVVFDGETPKSTKLDKAYHGYGVKSIKMTVDKYGGQMKIKAQEGVFSVSIIFSEN